MAKGKDFLLACKPVGQPPKSLSIALDPKLQAVPIRQLRLLQFHIRLRILAVGLCQHFCPADILDTNMGSASYQHKYQQMKWMYADFKDQPSTQRAKS